MTNPMSPDEAKRKLLDLVAKFDVSSADDLRSRVLELVPVHRALRQLGVSLFPDSSDSAARNRILIYLLRYSTTVISGEELNVVSGIQEWPRRVRELRTEFGWRILSGLTVAEMNAEQAFSDDDPHPELPKMRPSDYLLIDVVQDKEAATRWNEANSIRKGKNSVSDKILTLLQLNVGKQLTGEELRYVAKGKTEWARRVRELRTEYGWQVMTRVTGRPELPIGVYVLESSQQAPEHDRQIKDSVRRKVLQRDGYRCTNGSCGWSRRCPSSC